ncbi:MAG: ABC transporter substrate-binding protein [Chloroflexi bacterium]|nr:ABC transporter substrate-binding protein [Chloroflexota bacterium]
MNYRKVFFALTLVMVLALTVACAGGGGGGAAPTAAPAASKGEINVGSLNDLTGATSDVGKDYALGVQEAVKWINENGGINGKTIKLFQYDYGYRVPEAQTIYKRFRDFDKVVAVLGWGTGDTSALSPTINQDKMPYVSASYAGELTDPAKTPYNLFAAPDYSTSARAALTAWYEEVWKKDARFASEQSGKPRFIAFYQKSSPYSSAPIKALKEQATLLGFEIGADQDVALTALDTKSQVLAAKDFKPHVVWHGNTTNSVATALKDAKALALGADHLVNTYGYDENLPKLAGDAAEGVMGIAVAAFYGENIKFMDTVVASAKKYNPNTPQDTRLIHTVKAWANTLVLREAMTRADKAGKLNGEGIRAAFEELKDFDIGLGVTPLTWSSSDHRATGQVRIYQIKGGKFNLLKQMDMKAKYASDWPKWIGY